MELLELSRCVIMSVFSKYWYGFNTTQHSINKNDLLAFMVVICKITLFPFKEKAVILGDVTGLEISSMMIRKAVEEEVPVEGVQVVGEPVELLAEAQVVVLAVQVEVLAVVPVGVLAELLAEVQVEVLAVQVEVLAVVPAVVLAEVLAEVLEEVPAEVLEEVPAEVLVEVPAEVLVEVEVLAEVLEEVPAEVLVEVEVLAEVLVRAVEEEV